MAGAGVYPLVASSSLLCKPIYPIRAAFQHCHSAERAYPVPALGGPRPPPSIPTHGAPLQHSGPHPTHDP
jgi:hypothetical protein